MTTNDVIDYARYLMDAENDTKWSDKEIAVYVNEGIMVLNNHLVNLNSAEVKKKFVSTWATYDWSSGYESISTMMPDFHSIDRIYKKDTTLEYNIINVEEKGVMASPYFYRLNDQLWLYPVPTAQIEFDFFYFFRASNIDFIPAQFHEIFAYFAGIRMAMKDRQNDQLETMTAGYEQKKEQLEDFIHRNEPRRFVYRNEPTRGVYP